MVRNIAYLFLIGLIAFTWGCQERIEREVKQTYPDGKEKTVRYYRKDGEKKDLAREVVFYPEQQMKYEGEYRDGQRNGHWVYFYPNGKPWSEGTFKNGLSEGKRTVWYENGNKYYEGYYTAGKVTGKWCFYDENGKLVKEKDFGK